jgi:hypothetical protein
VQVVKHPRNNCEAFTLNTSTTKKKKKKEGRKKGGSEGKREGGRKKKEIPIQNFPISEMCSTNMMPQVIICFLMYKIFHAINCE